MKVLASRSRTGKRWPIAALAVADMIVFGGTNPQNVSSIILFIGFLLLVVNFYVLLLGALKFVAWYGVSPGKYRKRFIRLSAGVFTGLVALQSIGQLSGRDVLVVLPLALLGYMYLYYGRQEPATVPASLDSA